MINRTICCLTVSFAVGLAYGRESNIWMCLSLFCFLVFRAFWLRRKQGRKAVPVGVFHMLLCMVFFFGGAYHYQEQQEEFQNIRQYAKQQKSIQVQGEIYWKEQKQEQFIYYLKDAGIFTGEQWYPSGKIQVYGSTDSYEIGNCIQAVGTYEAFRLPRNEGNFNEEQYYDSKKIVLRMRAYQEQLLKENKQRYRIWLLKVRGQMEQVFQDNMSERTAGILANMTLGSKNLADQEVKSLYQKAGISHVLAVSGLHVSIFGMGLYRLLRRVYCPLPAASVLATGVVYSFGMLTGMELSTTRAVVMFVLMMTAGILGYTYDTITALSVSALLQLWENPFALWYAGFLFSYTAVLGAVVISRVIKETGKKEKIEKKEETEKKKKSRKWKWTGKFLDTVYTSFCIQMVTLPVSLFFYYEVSVYNVLTNGCVLPFMGILLFLGAAGGMAGLFQMKVTVLLLKLPEWILTGCEWVCQFFVGLPGSSMITGKPSMGKIIWYYVILMFLLYMAKRKKKRNCLLAWIALTVMLCCGNSEKRAEVDFLDVGQGDGIFLQSEEGNGVFIDGGSTDVGKVGTYRILPFLKYRGIKEIQLWFVSHGDADHISGLEEILESGYPVRNIVFADGIVRDEAWESLTQLAEHNGSHIYYLKAGESITLDELRFTVLYPWGTGTDRNQYSMVLLAELGGMTGLFSGDIGEGQEQELVKDSQFQNKMKKGITFYKAAHHGSDTSNSLAFLEAVLPEVTVVSCGADNSYGHPGKEAVERITETGSSICYTMENGQIKIWKEKDRTFLWKFQN